MRILLIGGSRPPEVCGIGDYTHRLAEALQAEGLDAQMFRPREWRLRDIHSMWNAVDSAKADLVHMQYPAFQYGSHLGPQLLCATRPCIVTIHEISHAHVLRQLSLYPFFAAARRIVFTTNFEREHSARLAPWIHKRSEVIPIGSNIFAGASEVDPASNAVGYFGLIRPNKGLEEVLALAALISHRKKPLRVFIIGSKFQGCEAYYEMLRQKSAALPIEWRIGLQGPELDAALAACGLAYLPYPDGASERRSSLLAFLSKGTPVITTSGAQTPESLKQAVRFSSSPENALDIAEEIMADAQAWQILRQRGAAYARTFSWSSIAERHVELYRRLCSQR